MKTGLPISLAVLTALAATFSLAAFQTGTPQSSRADNKAATYLPLADVPQWPYPPDSPPPPPDNGHLYRLPGSSKAFRLDQVYADSAADWFPEMHPKAPVAVIDGRPGLYFACGSCHLMNGFGKPDIQSLNALPVAYMQQQLEDMKNNLRHTSLPQPGADHMILVAKAVSQADADAALQYFHSIGPAKRWIRVVEAGMVPKTILGEHSISYPDPSGATEPPGDRVLELPENYERTLLRDPTSGYVAYVPPGTLSKGEELVRTGGQGRTVRCVACHGDDLRGIGDLSPPIAGRSPTAIARQLYDFKTNARHGRLSASMKLPVEKLTNEDIVDISAYLASLPQ